MKISIIDAINFQDSIKVLSSQKLPLKSAFKLNQILDAIEKPYNFYTKKFSEIINEYSKKAEDGTPMKDDTGKNIIIQEDKLEECQNEISELMNLDIDINDNLVLSLSDLGDIECSISDLRGLTPFLKD